MGLYESIFKRKSIRDYSERKLSSEKLKEIREFKENLNWLHENIENEVTIVDKKEIDDAVSGFVGSLGKVEAPHYIVVSSEPEDNYLENIGYTLEFLVLKLTSMGIGTCWLGSHFDEDLIRKTLEIGKDWEIPAIIAMGYPDKEDAFRDDPEQVNRKDLSEIVIDKTIKITNDWKSVFNAARLAPSAMNGQPWRFEIFEGGVHLFIEKNGGLVKKLAKRFGNLEEMNHIDAGIALSHIKIGAEHENKQLEFKKEPVKRDDLEYIISILEK